MPTDQTYLHEVAAQDVLDTLPANTASVTATSDGLSLGQVDKLIQRGAGQVNALLLRHGMDPAALDANSAQLARDAIIAYAGAGALERLGAEAGQVDRRTREWERLLKTLKEDPQSLGSAQDAHPITRTNIDTSERGRAVKRWSRTGYQY